MKCPPISIIFTALCLAFLACELSFAADQRNKFSARGVGGERCETLINIIDSRDDQKLSKYVPIFLGWIDGYISYINRIEKNTYNAVPFISGPEILALITQQCEAQPNMRIEETVHHTVSVLAKYKIKKESHVVNVKIDNKSAYLYKETIFEIQNKLNDLGFLKNQPDGNYSDTTIKAMKLFQKSKNIPESGLPTINTTIKLLYN